MRKCGECRRAVGIGTRWVLARGGLTLESAAPQDAAGRARGGGDAPGGE